MFVLVPTKNKHFFFHGAITKFRGFDTVTKLKPLAYHDTSLYPRLMSIKIEPKAHNLHLLEQECCMQSAFEMVVI